MDRSINPSSNTWSHHTVTISNMHCDDCAALIDDTLRALPGVRTVHATPKTGVIDVAFDARLTTPAAIVDTVTELGFHEKPTRLKEPTPDGPVQQQVSDAAWQVLVPVLGGKGKRVRDLRQIFEGIAYKWQTAVPWREVPTDFGPWQTLYARQARWRADGTWSRLIAVAASRDDLTHELAWLSAATPDT